MDDKLHHLFLEQGNAERAIEHAMQLAAQRGGKFRAGHFVHALIQIFPTQDGIQPLDGADGDLAHRVDVRGMQVLHVVQLGELAAGIRRAEVVEFGAGLVAKVGAVHQEQLV